MLIDSGVLGVYIVMSRGPFFRYLGVASLNMGRMVRILLGPPLFARDWMVLIFTSFNYCYISTYV